ncbi:MAG: hypothetical protein ACI81P_002175 [Neolewinella sp.]|jgi:hypothetical protein
MKYCFFLWCLLLSAGELFAQGNPPARVNQRWLDKQDTTLQNVTYANDYPVSADMDRGFGLHLMPFSFLNVLPRLRLGAQFKSKRFSYLLDLEYGFDISTELPNGLGTRDYRFLGIRPEIQYNIGRRNRDVYVGLEIPVSIVERKINGEFTSSEGERLSVDVASQDRFRIAVTGKVGVQVLIGRHLYLDAYTGLGVYFRDVEYTDRVGERSSIDDFRGWGFFGPVQEGKRWLPELALGVRAGWWF